jgi:hypothetical protein
MAMSLEDKQAALAEFAAQAGRVVNLLSRSGLKAGRNSAPTWLEES